MYVLLRVLLTFRPFSFFLFSYYTAHLDLYTLSLHDALPISLAPLFRFHTDEEVVFMANDTEFGLAAYFYSRDIGRVWRVAEALEDRKSTRLNSSHVKISYAVFCLKKKRDYALL